MGVFHLNRMAFDGNTTLTLQIHIVEHLSLRYLNGIGELKHTIGQSRLSVVDMRYDAEISYMIHYIVCTLICKVTKKAAEIYIFCIFLMFPR